MNGLIAELRLPVSRGVALFLALFTLLNIAGSHFSAGFDANIWWIDLSPLPGWIGGSILDIGAIGMLVFAIGLTHRTMTRRLIAISILALLIAATCNSVVFYHEWFAGRIHPGVPIPLSLLLIVCLGLVLRESGPPAVPMNPRQRLVLIPAVIASLIVFPLMQVFCFGKTDYQRPADAIVVFGARAYADGTPSQALFDRTRTAIDLYKRHLASLLIFSGGPGDGQFSEPQVMRKQALSQGVVESAIILDEHGLTTEDSVHDTVSIFQQYKLHRVLAVSHFYHLPRVKLAYARELAKDSSGVQIFTVPAKEGPMLPRMPLYIAREVAAFWSYYLRPLA
jgi:vancomycin permeability regulator SanA